MTFIFWKRFLKVKFIEPLARRVIVAKAFPGSMTHTRKRALGI
jgi:hypothetical protein